MAYLILGLAIFLGMHSVRIFADGWRTAMVARMGLLPWKAVYSVVSIAGFALLVWGYGIARTEAALLWTAPVAARHAVSLLVLVSFVLLAASKVPGTRIKAAVGHPMVAGVKLWAFAHLIVNGTTADVVLFGAFLAWAVADYVAARRRDRATGTTYPAAGWARDAAAVAIGVAGWAIFALFLHEPLIGVHPFR